MSLQPRPVPAPPHEACPSSTPEPRQAVEAGEGRIPAACTRVLATSSRGSCRRERTWLDGRLRVVLRSAGRRGNARPPGCHVPWGVWMPPAGLRYRVDARGCTRGPRRHSRPTPSPGWVAASRRGQAVLRLDDPGARHPRGRGGRGAAPRRRISFRPSSSRCGGQGGQRMTRGRSHGHRYRWLLLAVVVGLVAAACGDDDDDTTATGPTA